MTTKLLDQMPAVLSPRTVVRGFDGITTPLVDRIAASRRESRFLAALRDALLPKLISGELRIEDAEKFIGRAG